MEKSYYKDFFILEKEHWFFRSRRNILLYFIRKYAKLGSKIFDFGCGSGYLVGQLQRQGFNAYGMDFEKEAIDHGANSGIENLTLGIGNRIEHPDESFDLVTAFDVLEHIEKEESVIVELARILKQDGKIIITVPAYQWLWGIQDEISHHFRRYTSRSLTAVFKEFSELKIIRKTYFNIFLFPPIAIVRLLSKWFNGKNRKSDFDIKTGPLDIFLYHIFNFESYFLKFTNFPFGVSILFVLQKNDDNIKK